MVVGVPVISTEPDAGKILGSRWFLQGQVSKVSVKASSIWAKADKDAMVNLDLRADQFTFTNRGSAAPANMSDWLDGESCDSVTVTKNDQVLDWSQILDGGVKAGVSFRY